MSPIPVTLLTGFLGAGKTTLLNHILQASHGHQIAVIENEFGPVNIDSTLLIVSATEVVEMSNGCLCCTIRGDLAKTLHTLQQRKEAGELQFERVVIETTGLADPTPIAQTFFASPELTTSYVLDAVITVIDALHGLQQLDEHSVARRQAGFADRLLLSKTDLVNAAHVEMLSTRLATINSTAPQYRLMQGKIDLALLFDVRGFHLDEDLLNRQPASPTRLYAPIQSKLRRIGQPAADKSFNDDIAALHLQHAGPLDLGRISAFMNQLMTQYGGDLLRHKGVLAIAGEPRRLIFQGVHNIAGFDYGRDWAESPPRSDIVLIGRGLPTEALQAGFANCIVVEQAGRAPCSFVNVGRSSETV
ncbi:CobW family GTP-binding protein [Chitinimonas sp. BJB300]|uniref:CobW family GTP-binding protein n=1 Tax=Chitinimonas sp. BJB300 TaxID=1559339 RepID=UPI000C0D7E0F|nr:GTP-binding protein [Chitinimonas sp. BJB300]PHV12558.1 GTP-binding protein [Chitinimonas sp. BJB300]TSJ90047.1 GTP-binding protein [Chitinimonas sp. BJB300]